jgi:flagellar FliL protein
VATDKAKKNKAGKAAAGKSGGRKKLLMLALLVLLTGAGGGLWFSGVLPGPPGAEGQPRETAEAGRGEAPAVPAASRARSATFFDMPEIIANLNAPGRRASYIKLRSKLELVRSDDAAAVQQAMPRLLDLFNTYLREIRPEELRGSAGTQRLREELMARANIAFGANRVSDVLFQEILVQ